MEPKRIAPIAFRKRKGSYADKLPSAPASTDTDQSELEPIAMDHDGPVSHQEPKPDPAPASEPKQPPSSKTASHDKLHVQVRLWVPAELEDRVNALAQRTGIPPATLLRKAAALIGPKIPGSTDPVAAPDAPLTTAVARSELAIPKAYEDAWRKEFDAFRLKPAATVAYSWMAECWPQAVLQVVEEYETKAEESGL